MNHHNVNFEELSERYNALSKQQQGMDMAELQSYIEYYYEGLSELDINIIHNWRSQGAVNVSDEIAINASYENYQNSIN